LDRDPVGRILEWDGSFARGRLLDHEPWTTG
jgi:hypothetical protein